jgi:sulfotransferase family protein
VQKNVTILSKGLQRRGRLLAAALRPPGTGGKLVMPPPRTPRRLESPVLVLSCQRSGSTLLRVLLNSHSKIRAPHELHLKSIEVNLTAEFMPDVLGELDLDATELRYLVWDYVLFHELRRSGKEIIADKTPSNSLIWRQLLRCWPEARLVFLLRDPAAIVDSVMKRRKGAVHEEVVAEVLKYAESLESARTNAAGLTVHYEDLTADPEAQTRRLCEYLGVEWEREMLEYGSKDHGPFRPFFGDWSTNIKSGEIREARPAEIETPEKLIDIARAWGYLD